MMAVLVEVVWVVVCTLLLIIAVRLDARKWLVMDAALTFLFAACTVPFAAESQQMQVG